MVDRHLPGPSTPAEGVPALRAYGAQDCYFPGPSTPAEGVPALRAYGAQDCYLPGPSTPAEGVPALRAYAATSLLPTGAFDPGRGCTGPSGLCNHKIAIYRGLLGHFQACGKQIHNFPLFLFDVTKGVTALFENTINPRLVC
jgi:hypothetical protein